MIYFGPEWPNDEWRPRLAKAPPLLCLYCGEPICPDDSGVVMPLVTGVTGAVELSGWAHVEPEVSMCAYHRRCLLISLGIPPHRGAR